MALKTRSKLETLEYQYPYTSMTTFKAMIVQVNIKCQYLILEFVVNEHMLFIYPFYIEKDQL